MKKLETLIFLSLNNVIYNCARLVLETSFWKAQRQDRQYGCQERDKNMRFVILSWNFEEKRRGLCLNAFELVQCVMPKWYFSKERLTSGTPSRANGVDLATESRYRRDGCRFIMDMGNKLGLYPYVIFEI